MSERNYVRVWFGQMKDIGLDDWIVDCDYCTHEGEAVEWFPTQPEALDAGREHVRRHEANRCHHCGRTE